MLLFPFLAKLLRNALLKVFTVTNRRRRRRFWALARGKAASFFAKRTQLLTAMLPSAGSWLLLILLLAPANAKVVGTNRAAATIGDDRIDVEGTEGFVPLALDGIAEGPTQHPLEDYPIGTKGVNYDMDEEGRAYIECDSYNPNECAHGQCANKTTRCYMGEHMRLGCMAVWVFDTSKSHYDTSSMNFGLKGCWDEHLRSSAECIKEDSCEADIRQAGRNDNQKSLFCCCRTHKCNHKAILNAPIHPPTEKPPTSSESTYVSFLETFHQSDIWYAFVVIGFLLIVCLVLLITYHWYRQTRLNKATSGRIANASHLPLIALDCNDENGTLLSVIDPTPLTETKSLGPPEFALGEVIATGRFGKNRVMLATHKTPDGLETVACKQYDYDEADSYVTELDIFKAPLVDTCPYILTYLKNGTLIEGSGAEVYHIYTEYHKNGSLQDYLRGHELTLEEAFKMITSMMEGLAFLHEEIRRGELLKPIIVHRDFKSKNVLVKEDLSTCISDFGLSMKFESNKKPSGEKETIHTQVGTRRYMSPEVLEGATEFTPMAFRQIDVYAAALVVWEVLSRTRVSRDDEMDEYKEPFHDIEAKLGEFRKHVKMCKIRPPIREGLRKDPYTALILETVEEMWYQEPDGRVPSGCASERFNDYYKRFKNDRPLSDPQRDEDYEP
ncbi:hypothetical protein L596_024322 [Steinernema carpocapsae]|uniref:Serine/threonine-protein kinase receptor n=1 Tax=Steinernema carpocapsae TaxID=34508 RepID=A0A4U5MGE4_STECR|nr:hypothetical protein L596_024322 [Steinernema carpocapsae]